jgi:phosphatidylglycerophosphate synthase
MQAVGTHRHQDGSSLLDQPLRQAKEALFRPFVNGPLSRLKPDWVTRCACGVGLVCALAAAFACYRLAFGLWWLNRFLDGLDGSLARAQGSQSDWGGYQDIVLDHIVYAVIPIGIAYSTQNPTNLGACSLLQACYFVNTISWCYLAALLEKRQLGAQARGEMTSTTMPPALIEGTETVIFFSLFLAFPAWCGWLFSLKALLVAIGVWQRWRCAREVLR